MPRLPNFSAEVREVMFVDTRHEVEPCRLCRTRAHRAYSDVRDSLTDSSRTWNFASCTNPDCRVLQISPLPSVSDLKAAYSTYYTHTRELGAPSDYRIPSAILRLYRWAQTAYLQTHFGYPGKVSAPVAPILALLLQLFPGRAASLRAHVMYLPYVPDGKVLDVGCGNGQTLRNLSAKGWEGFGIETDEEAAGQARRNGANVDCVNISELAEGEFDAIVLNHVIEHIPEPRSCAQEILARLKPGGRLVIVTPNRSSLLLKLFAGAWRGLEAPRHLFIYSRSALINLLSDEGFETEAAFFPRTSAAHNLLASQLTTSKQRLRWIPPKLFLTVHAAARIVGGGEELVVIATKARGKPAHFQSKNS